MARALVKKLRRGDLFALTFVRDTLEGKPTRALELSGPEGAPIDLVARMSARDSCGSGSGGKRDEPRQTATVCGKVASRPMRPGAHGQPAFLIWTSRTRGQFY
jgi:hypothetical protein